MDGKEILHWVNLCIICYKIIRCIIHNRSSTSRRREDDIPSSPRSTAAVAALVVENYDVLTEILFLLPSKSLIRFLTVSKHWQSLIFDEFFTRRRHLKPQTSFLLRFCLKFDPSKSEHYEVYCLRGSRSRPDRKHYVTMYDSRSHEWKRWRMLSITGSGLYWYESIYWIRPHGRLFCFDLQRGEYNIYEAPVIPDLGRTKEYVFELKGRMYCAVLSLHPDENNLFLYRMLTNSWSRMYGVKFDRILITRIVKNNLSNFRIPGTINSEYADLLFHLPSKIMVHQLFRHDTLK
ncbi:hypothetical protein BUALT_Bualt12G0054500 [Buddleja alternifolia]|uniref:F-box domain-containing protein n=1 Tax=Buddleja alternifolia TaxID=168488 RepID=A0AAV6WMU0_9LAMI|nr:hypothetical protein BUALT_Bualt12G0054500 [Buddleja alternifolia]